MSEIENLQIEIKVLKERQSSLIKDYEIRIYNLERERDKLKNVLYGEERQVLGIKNDFERKFRILENDHNKVENELIKKNKQLCGKIDILKTNLKEKKSSFLMKKLLKKEKNIEEYGNKIEVLTGVIDQQDDIISKIQETLIVSQKEAECLKKENKELADKIETLEDGFKGEEDSGKIEEFKEIINKKENVIKDQSNKLKEIKEELEMADMESGSVDNIARGMMKIRKKLEQKTKEANDKEGANN